jgi:hypothetical protein
LTHLRFTKGIDFDLAELESTQMPGGARWVLARHPDAFAERYGAGIPVAGDWGEDRLSNAGERLKLSLGGGAPVIDFTYLDEGPWPEAADGEGHALVFLGEGEPNDPSQWTASVTGGSPGVDGSGGEGGGGAPLARLKWNAVVFDGAGVLLEWATLPARWYRVERSLDLVDWEVAIEARAAESDAMQATLVRAAGDVGGYLRVVELAAP